MEFIDSLEAIAQRDPQNSLEFIGNQPQQLTYDFGLTAASFGEGEVKNIVFAGMGGSSLAAELVPTGLTLAVPFVIVKSYHLPHFADASTLVICASASGNTEETVSVLAEAEVRGCKIAIIAHGGKLLARAHEAGHVVAELPQVPQPRLGVFYMYRATVELLVAAGCATVNDLAPLSAVAERLGTAVQSWLPASKTPDNLAKQLARDMVGKTPIIYAGPLMYPAAYKWKIDVNENAKNTAWCNGIPEFNHNEFLGWSGLPVEKPFAVIDLMSSFEHPRITARFEVTDRLLSGLRPKSTAIHAQGQTQFEHVMYLVLLGDFTTTYMALLNGVNPTPVALVEKFKVELG